MRRSRRSSELQPASSATRRLGADRAAQAVERRATRTTRPTTSPSRRRGLARRLARHPGARHDRPHARWAGGGAKHNKAPRSMTDLETFSYAVAMRYCGKFTRTRRHAAAARDALRRPGTSRTRTSTSRRSGRARAASGVPASPAIYAKLLKAIYTGVQRPGAKSRPTVIVAGGVDEAGRLGPDDVRARRRSRRCASSASSARSRASAARRYAHHPYRRSSATRPDDGPTT